MRRPIKRTSFWRPTYLWRPWTLHLSYARPEGGPILRGTPHKWRHVNGFAVILPNSSHWFEFRRFGS